MKKIIFTLAVALLALVSVAQEKGSYLTISGDLAATKFNYEMNNDSWSKAGLGFGGGLSYQYFFTPHVGLSLGVGLQRYNSYATYSEAFDSEENRRNPNNPYVFPGFRDDDQVNPAMRDYELQLRLRNIRERQEAYFLEIPLMVMFQTKWGKKEAIGMYFGIGAKAQLPIFGQKYNVISGEMDVLGYYPNAGLTLGDNEDPALPHHGFGKINMKKYEGDNFEGDLDLKTIGVAGTAELGLLFRLSRRVDLALGAYLDYGFMNIKDGNKAENGNLITIADQTHSNDPGSNLTYNGIINSNVVNQVNDKDFVNPISLGGKIGLRIKLGKLKEKAVEEEEQEPLVKQEPPKEEEVIVVKEEPVVVVQPVEEPEGVSEAELAILSEPIFFDLNKSELKTAAVMTLDRKVEILRKYPEINVIILGNTCDLGNDKINIPLGQRRAEAARDYLENKGISRVRMSTVTQAASHPIVPNTNEENRSKNRRDDFVPSGY